MKLCGSKRSFPRSCPGQIQPWLRCLGVSLAGGCGRNCWASGPQARPWAFASLRLGASRRRCPGSWPDRLETGSYSEQPRLLRPVFRVYRVGWWKLRPVLKHGPRSLTCMQANGLTKPIGAVKANGCLSVRGEKPVTRPHPRRFQSTSLVGNRRSIDVWTRKMVNYACSDRSQEKSWWRVVAILTCKSIVGGGYRGERLIEPSSSWFLPKFPSG